MQEEVFTISKDGFMAELYKPEKDLYPGKVIIAFSGSDGIFALSKKLANKFVEAGLTTMAVAYWNEEGLPKSLCHIPLEYLGTIGNFLKQRGYEKIGLWGISMGAEYALLAASYMPDLFSCVVAGSPIYFSTQGLTEKKLNAHGSTFSWNGKDIPYTPYKEEMTKGKAIKNILKRKEYSVRFMYDSIASNPKKDSIIPVTNMKASVLVFSGQLDSMWPSYESGIKIMEQLDQVNYPYPHEHYTYELGSHYMVPMSLKSDKLFVAERKYPEESKKYKEDIWNKTISFLADKW